jgi:hypothetical protein
MERTHFENGMNAFPDADYRGMTLRDYFAAKAMQPFLDTLVKQGWRSDDLQTVAETCYRAADAMMKAREA